MSIYTVNSKNTLTRKIELLNDMIKEVNGKVEQGKFDKNEIDQLFTDGFTDRKYIREVALGNTIATYGNWTHVQAETGYSIWKLTPSTYSYNTLNKLYLDNIVLDNRGEATSETATTFDAVYFYDGDSGSSYTDNTTEAGTESGTQFSILNSTNDYLYVGGGTTFSGMKFEFQTRGSGNTLKFEYYDDSSGVNDWVALTANVNSLDDDTSNFTSDGTVTFTAPTDWGTTLINGSTKYWIRISSTSTPTTAAQLYLLIPSSSVIGLLGMSSTQIFNEDWAWCTYSGSIYLTIRNTGQSAYEGNYYITSSSTATNLQNFFVYNHAYKLDHKDSSYDSVKTVAVNTDITTGNGIILIDASNNSVVVTLPTAAGNEGKIFKIKLLTKGAYTASVYPESGETIDNSGLYSFSSNYEKITVVSDGTEWWTI